MAYATEEGKPWILEQPREREEKTSMFKLDEFATVAAKPEVFRYTFVQCRFGAGSEKLTGFLKVCNSSASYRAKAFKITLLSGRSGTRLH